MTKNSVSLPLEINRWSPRNEYEVSFTKIPQSEDVLPEVRFKYVDSLLM